MIAAKKMLLAGTGLEAETRAFIARMPVKPDRKRAGQINNLVKGAKREGIWQKIHCLHLYPSHDAQASLLNWVSERFTASLGQASTLNTSSGVVSGYVNTNFRSQDALNYSASNFSAGGIARRASSTGPVASARDPNGEALIWLWNTTDSTAADRRRARFDYPGGNAFAPQAPARNPEDVFFAASNGAPSANRPRMYQNGVYTDGSAGLSGPMGQRPWIVSGFHNTSNGEISNTGMVPVRAFFGASVLTLAELSALENLLRTYLVEIGANT